MMNQKPLILLFISVLMLGLNGCKKDDLDFSSDVYFGIETLLESENCDADCNEVAPCEGEQVKVRGRLDASNINVENNQFYLIDESNDDFRLEGRVDESISESVFDKLKGMGGNIFLVEGEMEGVDANTNFSCKKIFIIHISDPSKVEQE